MKRCVFTVTGVMACLMLLSQPVNAQTTAGATFNLQAELKEPTCNSLTSSGDADGAGNVDFGFISSADGGNVEKTKHVVLTLTCDSAFPPNVAGIGFSVVKGSIDSLDAGKLYPEKTPEGLQYNLYYDWVWGQNINDTVMKDPGGNYTGLSPGQAVGLLDDADSHSYMLVQKKDQQDWAFPLDITRNVRDIAALMAGDYNAVIQVNIRYE
ncbi:hypothetical protein MXZ45_004444 [Salmonella enterica]|nr:hypothetical protein [Salmonella enterica]EJC0345947.1 hypothetical protein [Salmonella enterica]EJC0669255.1 hypothetical protein [Salmonella enterica]